jgi:hypothetical protein
MSCDPGRRRMYRPLVPGLEGVWAPAVHSNCLHNERAALLQRTLGPMPEVPVGALVKRQFAHLRLMARRSGVERMSRESVALSYSGRLRKRYLAALDSLREDPVSSRDAKIRAFLKAEKFNPLAKASKPRMIMARDPRFNLELAAYLKPIEAWLWRRWKVGFGGVSRSRVVGKGLDGPGRAALIARKMEEVGECVVFEVDGKAFEAHVTEELLTLEHSVYMTAFPRDSHLRWLLSCQRRLSGRTAGGIRYSRRGGRASGDYNTGLGNTMVMAAVVLGAVQLFEQRFGSIRGTILADGDNCLLFVGRSRAEEFRAVFGSLVEEVSPLELAVEKPSTHLEGCMFGQSRPCKTGRGLTMVRDPWKVLSHSMSGYRHFDQRVFGLRMLKAISECELTLALGVPVLQTWFVEVFDSLERLGVKDLPNPELYLEPRLIAASTRRHVRSAVVGVTAEARLSFELAWGLSVEQQEEMEARIRDGMRGLRWDQDSRNWLLEEVLVGDAGVSWCGSFEPNAELYLGEVN